MECPPNEASDEAIGPVFRFVKESPPSADCFASKAAMNEEPAIGFTGTACAWASCSMFTDPSAMRKLRGLKKRYPFIATLNIPAGSGRHAGSGKHLDFWRYATCDLTTHVAHVEEA